MGCGVSRLEAEELVDLPPDVAAKLGALDEGKRKRWARTVAPRESTASSAAVMVGSKAEAEEGIGEREDECDGHGKTEVEVKWDGWEEVAGRKEEKGKAQKLTVAVHRKEGSMDSANGRRLIDGLDGNGELPRSPSFRVYIGDDIPAGHADPWLLSKEEEYANTEKPPSKAAAPRHFRGRKLRALAKKQGASVFALFKHRHTSNSTTASTNQDLPGCLPPPPKAPLFPL